jgi:hypothetical protein
MAKAVREANTNVASSSTGEAARAQQHRKRPQKLTLLPAGRRPAASHPDPTVPFPLEPSLNIFAAAKALGMSHQCLRLRMKAGEIDYVRDGKLIRFRPEQLRDYIERHTVHAKPKQDPAAPAAESEGENQ